MNLVRHPVVALLLSALLGACVAPAPKPEAAPPAPVVPSVAPPAPSEPTAHDNLNAVAWSQTAIEHDLIYLEVYRDATDTLARALKDRSWDALPHEERSNPVRKLKPAIILDIDETVLDNSPYAARLVRANKSYEEATWAQWCNEKAAKALPGAREFTTYAASKGVTVFYLSNRAKDLNEVTLANLRSEGFPIAKGENVFLGLGVEVPGCTPVGKSDKGCRRRLIAEHYRVLMQFGDQLGDFLDANPNTLSERRAAVEPYLDWIGERWFVLPNPTYGSWEAAAFNNDFKAPKAQRHQEKLDNLRY
ncbi:MAG: acid phosphatase [Dokdonella sp.]|uniref:5'-nucleotidase, lipoprotein e(P4) family n=1 Tax=Dokdonella sp. TaxID=2291710 RepID=UPI0025B9FA31|nr:HAD family acid phosphatase [Dokdonella sp.]MBZ0224235.1 acid phosphatase [Dokdonella sp.]MCC7256612.1 acid phosphatase [Dokdonella sp.]